MKAKKGFKYFSQTEAQEEPKFWILACIEYGFTCEVCGNDLNKTPYWLQTNGHAIKGMRTTGVMMKQRKEVCIWCHQCRDNLGRFV